MEDTGWNAKRAHHALEDKAPPRKESLLAQFRAEDLSPYEWANDPEHFYPDHEHEYHKVIYVVQGSITFTLPKSGEALAMKPGDRLDLAAGTVHGAVVGPEGVVCLEAHRQPDEMEH